MRVKCIKQQEELGSGKKTGAWLTVGWEYDVLAVYFELPRGISLRLIGNDQFTPGLFPGELFEIVDDRIPMNWTIAKSGGGGYRLSPKPWLESGFWEKFFDRDPDAIFVFEKEARIAREL